MLPAHFVPDPQAERNLLITIFETESLPAGTAEQINKADLIFLRTEWNRQTFVRGGVTAEKIVVLPPPFDSSPFPYAARQVKDSARPFRWLSVFDWSLRKGHDLLIEAFAKTFSAGEAELWIKTNPKPGRSSQLQERCEERVNAIAERNPPKIHIVDSLLSQEDLRRLYAQADAFVLPSRGEGWGRPVQEAMLMQLPVLVTGATALDTLVPDESVGYRLSAQRVPVSAEAAAETPCFAGQSWFEVDPGELAARMREIYSNPQRAAHKAERARRYVLDLCDHRRIASRLAEQLSRTT
jgi:glycosyltransferase involved in cell wall biosynthesis